MKKTIFTIGIITMMAFATLFSGCTTQTDTRNAEPTALQETTTGTMPESTTEPAASGTNEVSYPIVDTGQVTCYNTRDAITCPAKGDAFYGQDAQYTGNQPSYTVSTDGLTVYDEVTGLTWQRSPDTNGDGNILTDDKCTLSEAQELPATLNAQNFGGVQRLAPADN